MNVVAFDESAKLGSALVRLAMPETTLPRAPGTLCRRASLALWGIGHQIDDCASPSLPLWS
jgi:hypothetical protein